MLEGKKKTLALSKYFVSLPHPAKTLVAIVLLSALFGALMGILRGGPDILLSLLQGAADGLVLLAIPAILSSIALYLLRKKAIFRRSIALGLVTVACYGIFYLFAYALSPHFPLAANLVFVGFGVAFVLWYFLLLLAFDFRRSAVAFASMQLAFFAFFYFMSTGAGLGADSVPLMIKMGFAALAFLAAVYFMFYVISAPMKKNLGVSSMDAISMFLSQWLYGEKDLEEVFDEMGEEVRTLAWLCEFRGKRKRTIFVVPCIHFGPFGNLGGSEFTWMISNALSKENDGAETFVFHGTATHDFNPVSSDEVHKVVGACRAALSSMKMKAGMLLPCHCKAGSISALALRMNDSAFLSYTRAPQTTEDVNLGIGLAIMERAKRFVRNAGVVDAHNAETGDISSVEVGNPIGFEMLDATGKALSAAGRQEKFMFGSSSTMISLETLGSNGLKLALFAQKGKMETILLTDSNGILPFFRDELVELLVELGKKKGYRCSAEVMTTDTHQINNVKGILNPLGSDRRDEVNDAVRKLFSEAFEGLEPVLFGAEEKSFGIRVFGSGQSAEIASTINAVVSLLRFALPAMLVGTALLLIWGLARI